MRVCVKVRVGLKERESVCVFEQARSPKKSTRNQTDWRDGDLRAAKVETEEMKASQKPWKKKQTFEIQNKSILLSTIY